MNRLGRLILPLAVATVACDSENTAESKPAGSEKSAASTPAPAKAQPAPKAAPAEAPPEPEAPAVEVSEAMTAFMAELGEHEKVTAAIEKYATEGLEADMGMYNIAEPTVTAAEPGKAEGETCYAMQAKTGAVQRKFRICWQGDKITAAENKGLAL